MSFDATGSTDPDGDELSYSWDFDDDGDGFGDSTLAAPEHVFQNPGTYRVRVRVSDGNGGTDIGEVTINVANDTPTIEITGPSASFQWSVGDAITATTNVTDDGPIDPSDVTWQLVVRHCPSDCHEHTYLTFDGVASGSAQ